MPKHVLTISDLGRGEILDILKLATRMKANREKCYDLLRHKTVCCMFEKPSLRTRVSLESGIHELGGHGVFYSFADGPKETFEDTANVLARLSCAITARVKSRETLVKMASVSTVPIINALDDWGHPMQMLADLLTIMERFSTLDGITLAFCGDLDNNVTYDLIRSASVCGFSIRVAGCAQIHADVLEESRRLCAQSGGKVEVCRTAEEAVCGADVVYADSWMSYGIPKDQEAARVAQLMPYQITSALMSKASPRAIFMNCLPAVRGMEQTAEVIDGPQSVVFDQAENRLHAQKALLVYLVLGEKVFST